MDRLFELKNILDLPGISFSDAFIQRSGSRHAIFDNGKFEEVSATQTEGVGVRIVVGDRTYFTHSTGATSLEAGLCISEGIRRAGISTNFKPLRKGPPLVPLPEVSIDAPFARIRELGADIRKESSMVKQVSFGWSSGAAEIAVLGTESPVCRASSFSTRFSASVVIEKDGSLFSGREVSAFRLPPESFLGITDIGDVAFEALRRALVMVEAKPCPAGIMPVVLAGEAGGTMIHEACGHSLEADIIMKDYSTFRNSMGKLVASPIVSLMDDPTIPGLFGSYAFDGEGTVSRGTLLIKDGVLQSFLTDIQSSIQGGFLRTGNGRRSSYRVPPMPRMSNTFIMKGEVDPGSIVSGVREGLLVKKMGGGEVNPTSGDFVFHVTEGYLIKNGKISWPVKNAILTGNGPQVLMDIEAVGNDIHFEAGMCGKSGQDIPVTDGQPTLLIREIIVGGSDTGHENY
ncbi:MAG: TldD/PmbA family protein [Thermovirgaceae bacterium]|nr:TldD/PmbA family protein [Thermovirgaceae bacterium]